MSSFSKLTLSLVITTATLIVGVGVTVNSLVRKSKCIVNCEICTWINRRRKEEIKSESALYLIEIVEAFPGISMQIALGWKAVCSSSPSSRSPIVQLPVIVRRPLLDFKVSIRATASSLVAPSSLPVVAVLSPCIVGSRA